MEEEYLQTLYGQISSLDPSFTDGYSLEGFISDMQDSNYAAEIYNTLGGLDQAFKVGYPIESFLNDVTIKKKDSQLDGEPMEGTVSPTQEPQESDTSSALSQDIIEYDISPSALQDERQVKIDAAKKQFTELYGFEPRDMRETGYLPPEAPPQPTTGVGGVSDFRFQIPSDIEDKDRKNQIAADQAFTSFMVELEQPELNKLQAQEKAERQIAINTAVEGREEIIQDPDFNEALNKTDLASIQTEEDKAVGYFNDLYGRYGFTFRPVGVGDAMEVTQTLSDGNVVRETIDLDTWFDSNALVEAEKLKNFVTKYAYKPEEKVEKIETNSVQSAIRAKYLRDVPRINDDGTESTVLFESANIDGKNVVYPTLFQKNPEIKSNKPMYWMELDGMEAFEEAKKRGELFYFKTAEEADEFARGSWKDISNVDAEADRFFANKGYDYLSIKNQVDEYEDARDKVLFIESLKRGSKDQRGFDISELSPYEQEEFSEFYTKEGKLRADYLDIYKEYNKRYDELTDLYLDDDIEQVRDEYDVFIDKQLQDIRGEAVKTNAAAKYVDNELNTSSYQNFGLSLQELAKYEPKTTREAEMQDAILTTYEASKKLSQVAADKYEVSKTYLDSKFDKNLRGEIVEGWAGVTNAMDIGEARGEMGAVILQKSLGLTGKTTKELANEYVDYMEDMNTGKTSQELNRYHRAKGFREVWDSFSDSPVDMALQFAGESLSQMLPYGKYLIPAASAIGTATGAAYGTAVAGPVGTIPGGIAGLFRGFRTGFMATTFGLEYTNAVMNAIVKNNYNPMIPEQVEQAFNDPQVWKDGNEEGFKRGIPILLTDIFAARMAGRVFNVGKTAGIGRRLAAQATERILFDPLSEGVGEYLAQVSYDRGINMKDVFAEMIGGLGANSSFAAVNMALDLRSKNNLDIANSLATIEGLNNELKGAFGSTPSRVSNWANSMEELGQISKKTNQRIQSNLGVRQNAQNVLSATEGKTSGYVLNRAMQLMAAKDELSSTTNRKEIFGDKIKQINAELKELAETKIVRKPSEQVALDEIGTVMGRPDIDADIRENVRAKYIINGKRIKRRNFLSRINERRNFLSKINDMSDAQILASDIVVENDEETRRSINKRFEEDAIQEQETRAVPDDKQAGDIQEVEGEVRTVQEEQAAEPTTTPEGEVERLQDSQIPVSQEKITYENDNGETGIAKVTTQLDGSRKLQLLDEEGTVFSTERIPKDNTLTNEDYITKVAGEVKTTEEVDIETVRNPKTEERMSNRQREAAGLPVREKVEVEATEEVAPEPKQVRYEMNKTDKKIWRKDFEIIDNRNGKELGPPKENGKWVVVNKVTGEVVIAKSKRDAQNIIDNAPADPELFGEGQIVDADQIITPETGIEITEDKEAVQQEEQALSDFEATIALEEKRKRGEVKFKTAVETVEGRADVEAIVEEMNKQDEGAIIETTAVRETMPDSPKIDVDELNSRVDNPIPTVEWKVIDGVPVIFNISDQLRTGDVVNPLTGTTITNLKGGMGFVGINGHENIAWASVNEDKVRGQLSSAINVYENNKSFFDSWWKANPEYNGLVPMVIVKMGSDSILSNEAVIRVLADNLKSFSKDKKVRALKAFEDRIQSIKEKKQKLVDTGLTQKGKKATKNTIDTALGEIAKINDVQQMIKQVKVTSIEQLLTPKALKALKGITSVNIITQNIAYGKPNSPSAKKVTPGTPQTPVSKILLEGEGVESRAKLHLGSITDIITEPQLKNTPTRSAFMITGVDVLSAIENKEGSIIKTNHPNYPVGPKGKVIGIIEQPQSIVELFPAMYNNVVMEMEKERRGETKQRSESQRLMQTLPVQAGLNNLEYVGSRFGIDNVGRFMDFINRSFPFMNISTDQETMNRALTSARVTPHLRKGDVVYGLTADNQILINSEVHNSESELFNTAIHEMGEVWVQHIKLTPKGRKLYNRGEELMKQTKTYQRLLKRFDGDVEKAVDETMTTLIGNKGESVVDASLKQKIKDWIAALWSYVRDNFKLSKDLTTEEIQNLTLDEFLETAVADILKGKPIDISDKNLNKLTEGLADVLFKVDDTMNEIIRIGRENGYTEAQTIKILQGRGFKTADITEAMNYQLQEQLTLFNELPPEFARVDGGVKEAAKMFTDVRTDLYKFATSGGKNVVGKRRVKSYSEIRQKAQDLIQQHPVYLKQTDQVQMELRSGLDRSLGYRKGRNVSREIARIRGILKQRNIGARNLKDAQVMLRNFIRATLPESNIYTRSQINKLLNSITNIKSIDDFYSEASKVLSIVDNQRAKMKRAAIQEIVKIVKSKAVPASQAGKRRAKGIDSIGQVIFSNVKKVLNAVQIRDEVKRKEALALVKLELDANQSIISEAERKLFNDEDIKFEEESLVQLQLAYDMFANLDVASLEETNALLDEIKNIKKESILRFNSRRLKIAEDRAAIYELANEQIKQTDPILYNPNGTLRNSDQMAQVKEDIENDFTARGIMNKVYNNIADNLLGRKGGTLITDFKNLLTNIGTITNFLDRKNEGLTLFEDYVHRPLRRKREYNLSKEQETIRLMDDMAKEVGFEEGFDGVEIAVDNLFGKTILRKPKTKTFKLKSKDGTKKRTVTNIKLNANQLLRVYALSKNDVQGRKLENMGFTQDVINTIKEDLGPKLIKFADNVVEYLSTTGFNQVNAVYKQVNDVNLGYIANYFPTRTIVSEVTSDMMKAKNADFNTTFNAEYNDAFKERIDRTADIKLKEATFTGTFRNHMLEMSRYKSYAELVNKLNSFFKSAAVNAVLTESGLLKPLQVVIQAEVNPYAAYNAMNKMGKGISKLLSLFSSYVLSFRLVQIPKQLSSFIEAWKKYSYLPKEQDAKLPMLASAVVDAFGFTVDTVATVARLPLDLFGKGPFSEMRKLSATLNDRAIKALEGDVHAIESGSQTLKLVNKKSDFYSKQKQRFKTARGATTMIGDLGGVMGYYIPYRRNLINGMSQDQALELFNEYEMTQQSRAAMDKTPLQLSGSFAYRMLGMFASTQFLQMNNVMRSSTNIGRAWANVIKLASEGKFKEARKAQPTKEDYRNFYISFSVANILFTGVANIALLLKGDEKDRDLFWKRVKDAGLGLNILYNIPVVGDALNYGIAQLRGEKAMIDGINPLVSISKEITKNIKDDPDRYFRNYVKPLIEFRVGAKIDPFVGMYNAINDGVFGEFDEKEYYDNIYDAMGLSASYRPGYGRGKAADLEGVMPVGGIRTKAQLKRFNPYLYEEIYGERDELNKELREQEKEEIEAQGYKKIGNDLYPIE